MRLCVLPKELGLKEQVAIENAKRLFAKYGFADVTLDDIARGKKAGEDASARTAGQLSRGTLRALFKKEDLLRHVMDGTWRGILDRMDPVITGGETVTQKIRKLTGEIIYLPLEDLDAVGVLVRERYPYADPEFLFWGCPQARTFIGLLVCLVGQVSDEYKLGLCMEKRRSIGLCLAGAIQSAMLDVYLRYAKKCRVSHVEALLDAHRRVKVVGETLAEMIRGIGSARK